MDVTRTIHHSMDVNTSWRLMPIPYRFGCVSPAAGSNKFAHRTVAKNRRRAWSVGRVPYNVARTWTVGTRQIGLLAWAIV